MSLFDLSNESISQIVKPPLEYPATNLCVSVSSFPSLLSNFKQVMVIGNLDFCILISLCKTSLRRVSICSFCFPTRQRCTSGILLISLIPEKEAVKITCLVNWTRGLELVLTGGLE
ncbi:hypothetical protein RirG_004500 [Rhizophagus irregularis DAOM 197198w]|uniref:Uncharacterized protein n=1 Tax=Rhizophagus irregularis (strain DAOM 197198w) TaxID=1432141 RepID=A0A015KCN3_RHIIW|nr:hypothetical protein RirG_004500 [Rhizophagus irregularis DAOM 197198w]